MSGLIRGYGRGLVALFFGAVLLWALLLIVLPQLTMVDKSLRAPARQHDSSIAYALERDAETCQTVLRTLMASAEPAPAPGGLAVPSPSGMAIPSPSTMGIPSPSMGPGSVVIQCVRATTDQRLIRDADEGRITLAGLYDLPLLEVDGTAPFEQQIAQAEEIRLLAADLKERLQAIESQAIPYVSDNFGTLVQARRIPLSPDRKAFEDSRLSKQMLNLLGLRFERDGQVYERISLVTLLKTILFAVLATGLALIVCYPIAYNLALGVSPRRAVWLFLGLIIPYAIVELLRVYAWVSIIDNNGLVNRMLDVVGVVDLEAGEFIQFKRSSLTVFVVIVYTYILFMVFPVFNVMATLDRNQIEAARDLGSSTWRVHWRVVIPHAKPGIAVGCIATFMLSAGAFSVPRIISRGLQSEWFTQTIYNKFFESENSNVGAAYAIAYTIICFIIVGLFMWVMRARLKDFVRA